MSGGEMLVMYGLIIVCLYLFVWLYNYKENM